MERPGELLRVDHKHVKKVIRLTSLNLIQKRNGYKDGINNPQQVRLEAGEFLAIASGASTSFVTYATLWFVTLTLLQTSLLMWCTQLLKFSRVHLILQLFLQHCDIAMAVGSSNASRFALPSIEGLSVAVGFLMDAAQEV